MAHAQTAAVLHHLRRLAGSAAHNDLSDRQLLSRFATSRDESAFAELLRRHGPLVLGACRRLLRHEQDAEDAFQATFLVLARKADSVRKGEAVGSWDVTGRLGGSRLQPLPLMPRVLEVRWNDLAGADARRAVRAVWDLAARPQQAVPFLRKQFRPVGQVDGEHLARLARDLDSDRFATRRKAADELQKAEDLAEPALRQELARKPALEVRQRIERLLAELEPAASPERLRALRAVQVLEYAGTAEAEQVLQTLARGAPEALLTRQARAALKRLIKGVPARP